ncbi:MAG: class A beta-lactamase-related serine hydrolase [Alphaproteobacteria bacterium]|nr:MAG: class A beta-lactamase-related serine hydrolase [Alphaproteobacteria bacterium]
MGIGSRKGCFGHFGDDTADMMGPASLSVKSLRRFMYLIGGAVLFLCTLTVPGKAQVLAQPSPLAAPYEAWFDAYFDSALKQSRTVGGAVIVVSAQKTLFAKGYGYGDFASREPINPEVTFLPIADVGTVLVSQTLLMLADRQQVSLDQPANGFLTRLQLPGAMAGLTIADIQAGDYTLVPSPRGSLVPRGSHVSGIEILRRHLSGNDLLASFPGRRGAYDAAVLATLVEDVTGRPLVSTLDQKLSADLGLQPFFNLPGEALPRYMVHQHRISRFGDIEMEPTHASPAAFLSSNGIALTLADTGRLAKDLLTRSATPEGQALLELSFSARNGNPSAPEATPVWGLGGDVQTVTTDLILIPSRNVAVFVMLTGAPKSPDYSPARGRERIASIINARDVTNDFMDHWIVPANQVAAAQSELAVDALTGAYVAYSLPLDRPEEVFGLQQQTTEVRLNENGALEIDGNGPFIPMGPTTFRNPASGATAEFMLSPSREGLDLHFGGVRLIREGNRSDLNLLLGGLLVACLFTIQLVRALGWPTKRRIEGFAAWVGAFAALAVIALLGIPTYAYFDGWPSPYLETSIFSPLPWLIWALVGLAALTGFFALWSWQGYFWALDGRGFVRRRQYTFGALGLGALVYLMAQTGMLAI